MRWWRPMLRGRFFRQVAVLTGGTAVGQLILVAATPLLTRLYSPTDMGVFGLFYSFLGVASVAVCWRLEWGVASAAGHREAARLLLICLILCVPMSAVLAAALALMIAGDVLSFGLLPAWSAPLAALALAATGVFSALRYWHVREQAFRAVSVATVWQAAGRAATSIALGLAGAGSAGLMAGELAGRVLGVGGLWRRARAALREQPAAGAGVRLTQQLGRVWRYPLVVLPSSLIDATAAALPVPVIAYLFGAPAAGLFALVWRVASIPGALIASSVGDVFHAHAVEARQAGGFALRRLLLRTLGRLALLATGVYLPLCLLSPWAFGLVFGPEWAGAGQLMLLLFTMWWTATVVSPVSRLLIVIERPGLKLVFDLIYLAAPILALFGVSQYGLDAAVLAYGLAASGAYVVFGLLLAFVAGRESRHGPTSTPPPDPPR